MKERIQDKLNQHVEEILAKNAISNEECLVLFNVLQKIEKEEKEKIEAEKAEEANRKYREHMQALYGVLNDN
jgi:hypothetical protein